MTERDDTRRTPRVWRIETAVTDWHGPGLCEWQFVTIEATEERRDEWEARFWCLFPLDPRECEELARGPEGIHVSIPLEESPLPRVKSQYGRYSASKLGRILGRSNMQPPPSPELQKALDAFRRDFEADEAMRKELLLSSLHRLPRPLLGYYWASDYGGLLMGDALRFRLWCESFGWMPRSE